MELKVTVININPGYNRELLEKCESLSGYTTFVEKARNKRGFGMRAEEAVRQAVDALKIPTADRNTFMEKLRIKQEEEK